MLKQSIIYSLILTNPYGISKLPSRSLLPLLAFSNNLGDTPSLPFSSLSFPFFSSPPQSEKVHTHTRATTLNQRHLQSRHSFREKQVTPFLSFSVYPRD